VQTHEIITRFRNHFERNGHTVVPSAPLLVDDPNLLFVNAGMVPFKPYFLGEAPPPYQRATSVQKCVRTPDIDEVGKTTRHNTFFQMAGNFSFGDYFKEGAIALAWELITAPVESGGYGFDPERIWPTVYHDDDEALELCRVHRPHAGFDPQRPLGGPHPRAFGQPLACGPDERYIPSPRGRLGQLGHDKGPKP